MSASGERCGSSVSTCSKYAYGSTPHARHVSIKLYTVALAFAPATVSLYNHDFLPVQNGLMSRSYPRDRIMQGSSRARSVPHAAPALLQCMAGCAC
jgi:hypothetical protein